MYKHLMTLALSAVFYLGSALAQPSHAGHNSMAMQSMGELQKLSGRNFDIAYMSMMIEHHKGAVEMAQAILKTSKDARIRKAAQEIVTVQKKEIAQLEGWLKAWYGISPSQRYMQMMRADMQPMMEASMKGMQVMPGHAMPVDRAFLEGMIPHHQDAVDMSRLCLQKAARSELRRFCQGVIELQSREIAQFKGWLEGLR
ncbi:DUF305 domain-containing protein [Meiothermus rufus]|uniref:DUF305 domain-containing protein n=1 Tax=Meiothermus rufus TaxID=604332 RepID=UPI00040C931D|nr:DUF305 domain-containing protein [Meiothermus rufus]